MARFEYRYQKGEFVRGIESAIQPMANAATAAVDHATKLAVVGGQLSIAAAGFPARWQKGLRGRLNNVGSLKVQGVITHRFGFAGIFEEGGTIKGKPFLYLPIEDNLPRGKRRPKAFAGKLVSARNRGDKPPILLGPGKFGLGRVPLFVGVKSVTIKKRWDIAGAVRKAAARLGEFYFQNLRV